MDLIKRKSTVLPLVLNIVNFIISLALTIAVLVLFGQGNVCSQTPEAPTDPTAPSFKAFSGCLLKPSFLSFEQQILRAIAGALSVVGFKPVVSLVELFHRIALGGPCTTGEVGSFAMKNLS